MKFAVLNSLDQQPPALIVPMMNNGAQEAVLQSLATATGLDAALLQRDFKAELGEIQTLYLPGQRLYLLGLGSKPQFADVQKAFRSFSHKMKQKFATPLGISFLHDNLPVAPIAWAEAAVNGLLLGAYHLGRFKTTNSDQHPFDDSEAQIQIFIDEQYTESVLKVAQRAQLFAETQMQMYDLVNAPSNKKIPNDLAQWAVESGKKYGYRVEIWDKTEIERQGLHALLAVNQGSNQEPRFIIMEHKLAGANLKKVGLVGKGVTFDTGGLSIKPAANMHLMKSDMGGAAAVLGAMEMLAKLQLPIHVIGVVPATENSVDANALKPSDVIGSYSGKTIEVIDTDAEGRLILADGLTYVARHFQPDYLINLATLTGSTVRTFGYHVAGLYCNNDDLADHLFKVGERTGERIWRLPIWDVYKEEVKSDVADVRNISGKPVAGGIAAAKFLEVFIENHPAWAHLDIAGTAFVDSEFASQRSATAFGVRLLLEFMEDLTKIS
ncbi:MAG: leucyl aminopeptidase [Saprospiraceae bacterium]